MESPTIGTHRTAPARLPFYADAWLYFLLGLGVKVAGFWPSFFSRPAANPGPYTLHGVVATAWRVPLTCGFAMAISGQRMSRQGRIPPTDLVRRTADLEKLAAVQRALLEGSSTSDRARS
jgi:hypothetical protein